MMARLAVARATKRTSRVVVETDNQAQLIRLLRSVDPTVVLSLVGEDGVRIHGTHWGKR